MDSRLKFTSCSSKRLENFSFSILKAFSFLSKSSDVNSVNRLIDVSITLIKSSAKLWSEDFRKSKQTLSFESSSLCD